MSKKTPLERFLYHTRGVSLKYRGNPPVRWCRPWGEEVSYLSNGVLAFRLNHNVPETWPVLDKDPDLWTCGVQKGFLHEMPNLSRVISSAYANTLTLPCREPGERILGEEVYLNFCTGKVHEDPYSDLIPWFLGSSNPKAINLFLQALRIFQGKDPLWTWRIGLPGRPLIGESGPLTAVLGLRTE